MYRKRASVYVNSEKAGSVKQRERISDSIFLQTERITKNSFTPNTKFELEQICYVRSLMFDTALHQSRD